MIMMEGRNYFSLDLVAEILSWLPVNHLLRLQCVSKSWCNLINDPAFIKLHLNRSKTSLTLDLCGTLYSLSYHSLLGNQITEIIHYDNDDKKLFLRSTSIVGSCNGLLCLQRHNPVHNPYYYYVYSYQLSLYNPATRAYRRIVPIFTFQSEHISNYDEPATWLAGDERLVAFGYDSVSDDYKILMLIKYSKRNEIKTMLYSSKTNIWGIIQNPPWNWELLYESTGVICANSALHWLVRDESKVIRCFNLFNRRYYEKPLSRTIYEDEPIFAVLRGKLCAVTRLLDIWILEEYSVDNSWTRVFHNQFEIYAGINTRWNSNLSCGCIEDGHNIFLVISTVDKALLYKYMFYCDPKSGKIRVIVTPGSVDKVRLSSPVQTWVESLVPLKTEQQRTQKRYDRTRPKRGGIWMRKYQEPYKTVKM